MGFGRDLQGNINKGLSTYLYSKTRKKQGKIKTFLQVSLMSNYNYKLQ